MFYIISFIAGFFAGLITARILVKQYSKISVPEIKFEPKPYAIKKSTNTISMTVTEDTGKETEEEKKN